MHGSIHPIFSDKPGEEDKLWRYVSFAKLAALFQSSSLHFARIDKFDDHFEGAWPKGDLEYLLKLEGFNIPAFTEQIKRSNVAASCWIEMPRVCRDVAPLRTGWGRCRYHNHI
jgi:hypothetical protein